jgi:hypothetical protein
VAFFCSFGGRGADKALREMQQIVGKPAVAECKVTASEALHGIHAALAVFVSDLERQIAKSWNFEWAC